MPLTRKPLVHGTHHAYGRWGCRCEDCKDGERLYRQSRQEQRDFTSVKFPHGERRGYRGGCRCNRCLDAARSYEKQLQAQKDKTADDYPHGTRKGARHGCKCEPCLDAKRDHEREYVKHRAATNKQFRDKRRSWQRQYMAKRKARIVATGNNAELIDRIYAQCPDRYQVDHIVPLSRDGEHVPDNLQYLTTLDNRRKGNRLKFKPSDPVIRWQNILIDLQRLSRKRVGGKCRRSA